MLTIDPASTKCDTPKLPSAQGINSPVRHAEAATSLGLWRAGVGDWWFPPARQWSHPTAWKVRE